MLSTKTFNGVPIVATSMESAVDHLLNAAEHGPSTTVRLVNAGTFDAAATRPDYMALLKGEGQNLPDGRPLAAVLQFTSPTSAPCNQVRGPRLFEETLNRSRTRAIRHFLLGASEQTLAQLSEQIEMKFPGTQIVGTYSPPFRERSSAEIDTADSMVTASGANLVWVALGTPKQDAEALRITRATGITTAAVGAAFDFTAGTKRSSPAILQRAGLEWLFRLATEPRRLWRRYLVGNARFVAMAFKHFASR